MSNLKGSQTAAEAPSSGASATKDGKKKNDENLSQNWIFVGNLTVASKSNELKELFCHFGKVLEFFINSNLGFASVKMDTRENAEEAIRKLDGMELHGEKILLRFASEEKSLKVDTYSTAIKVGNLSPVVTNERLKQAFQQFGQVERAVVIADNEGNSTTRGIVEFKRVLSAQNAVKQIEEGCFLITSSPRPISATLIEQEDSNCGVPEEKITKTSQYIAETMKAPRFAVAGSFEQQIAQTWKIRYQLERQQRDQVEENIARSRKIFEEQLITCFTKQQAAMKIKQEALSHSDEEEMFVQERKRIRMEASQRNNDETPSNIVRTPQQNAVKKEVEEPTTKEIVPFCPVKVTTRPTAPSLLADNWKDGADEEEHLEIEEMITNETDSNLTDTEHLEENDEKFYQCGACMATFAEYEDLKEHMKKVRKEKNNTTHPPNPTSFNCFKCKKSFPALQRLNVHVAIHTGEKTHECNECSKRFLTRGNLKTHMSIHLDAKPFRCEVCRKRFKRKHDRVLHMRQHTGEKPNECHICHRCFSNPSYLSKHISTHVTEMNFKCELCPGEKLFKTKQYLRKHMQIHNKEKIHKCFQCDMRFLRTHDRTKHERIHLGIKPFECEYCQKRFTQSIALIKHIRTHTGEKPYKCELCGVGFTSSQNAKKHMNHEKSKKFEKRCDYKKR